MIARLRQLVQRDRYVLRMLNVSDIRKMLQEIERSDLNRNIALLLKKLTGIGPPHVSEDQSARIGNLFAKAIEAGERVQRHGRVNRTYYPFFIYKIIQSENDPALMRLLYYIYVQGQDTIEADDLHWEQICKQVPELTYYPTIRGEAQKYAPI